MVVENKSVNLSRFETKHQTMADNVYYSGSGADHVTTSFRPMYRQDIGEKNRRTPDYMAHDKGTSGEKSADFEKGNPQGYSAGIMSQH